MRRGAWIGSACAVLVLLAGCHRGHSSGGGSGPAPAPQSYGASLTSLELSRTADGQPLPVAGLPAEGAELTVR